MSIRSIKYVVALFLLFLPDLLCAKIVIVSPRGDELQQAFNGAVDGDVIFLKKGTYVRANNAAFSLENKNNITIIGEERDSVIISRNQSGTSTTGYTAFLRGNDWYVENVTFENLATDGAAMALRSRGDRMIFNNCKLRSHQDTHLANSGMQYFFHCETWGDVDFIYGDAAVMYDSCVIVSRKRKGGYITAPEDAKMITDAFKHGIVVKNSELRAESGLADNTCYLGRPWKENCSSVFLNCTLGAHIKPEGWQEWDNGSKPGIYVAEYSSAKADGAPADVSQRVAWSTQLAVADTSRYGIPFFFKGWNPRAKLQEALLLAPANICLQGDSLRWVAVPGARGYLVFRNDSLYAYTSRNAYSVRGRRQENYIIRTLNSVARPSYSVPDNRLANAIAWEQELVATMGDEPITLTATAGSGLPVHYTTSDESVVKIVDEIRLQIVGVGQAVVTAWQSGDDNYKAAVGLAKTVTVEVQTAAGKASSIPLLVYPNPAVDAIFISFEQEDSYGITLVDMSGSAVFQALIKGVSYRLDVGGLAEGIYSLSVVNSRGQRTVQKVVLTR